MKMNDQPMTKAAASDLTQALSRSEDTLKDLHLLRERVEKLLTSLEVAKPTDHPETTTEKQPMPDNRVQMLGNCFINMSHIIGEITSFLTRLEDIVGND
jgi:hypothetical protein